MRPLGIPARVPPRPGSKQEARSRTTLNLFKNVIGPGVFTLPAGVGLLVNDSEHEFLALPGAAACAVVFGLLCGYSFYLIGEACARTGATTYRGAWTEATEGDLPSWLPTLAVLAMTSCGSIGSLIVAGSSTTELLAALLGMPVEAVSHDLVLAAITGMVLLPLCLQDFKELAWSSLVGTVGTGLMGAFVILRFFDGSYGEGGEFFEVAKWHPSFESASTGTSSSAGALVLISMLSNAFSAHYNAPVFWKECAPEGTSTADRLDSFRHVCLVAFGASVAVCLAFMASGYLTFGLNAQWFLLDNYTTGDPFAIVARLGLLFSALTIFPLLFIRLRDDLLELFLGVEGTEQGGSGSRATARLMRGGVRKQPDVWTPDVRLGSTVGLLLAMALVGSSDASLGTVNGLSGSLGGGFLCYAAPGIIAWRLATSGSQEGQDQGQQDVPDAQSAEATNLLGPAALVVAGSVIAVLGTGLVLSGAVA